VDGEEQLSITTVRYILYLEEETVHRKISEDIRKIWEYYPTPADVNSG